LTKAFTDGPVDEGGLRYYKNSDALKFIPYDKITSKGYEDLVEPLYLLNSKKQKL